MTALRQTALNFRLLSGNIENRALVGGLLRSEAPERSGMRPDC
jgi:hypothetical protein